VKSWAVLVALLCASAAGLRAADFGSPGTAGADFLKIASDTRAAGMGGAVAASGLGLEGLEYNPAQLDSVLGWELSAQHLSYAEGIALEQLALGWGKPGLGAGLSVLSLSTPDIPTTDITGAQIGTFKQQDMALTAGLGYALGRFSLGLSGQGLQRSLAGLSYSGAAGDLGAEWNPYGGWRLGLAAQNLGSLGALSQEADPAPMTFRGGLAWVHAPQDGLAFTGELDAVQPRDSAVQARLGFEAGWSYFFARAGAQFSQAYDGTQPFSVGAGVRFSSWEVDYSFAEMQDLGTAQRFGLTWRLDGVYGGRKGLQAPGGLAIKRDGKDLLLSWEASPNAAGYAIYLRKGQDLDLLHAGQTKASQTHLRLKKAGSLPLLGLAVSTLGQDGQESPLSDELRVSSGEARVAEVPRPSGLQLKALDGRRALQWSGPQGAEYSYQVLVSRRSGNGYAPLGKPVVQLQKFLPDSDEWKDARYVVVQTLRDGQGGQEASALSKEMNVLPR
jgi:hypothetical protein